MTDTTGASSSGRPDPFVTQIRWLIAHAGGKDQLVQRCGGRISTRTLDNWSAGSYPQAKVTGAVRDLDAWARESVPGYPEAAGVPALIDSCGPYRLDAAEPSPPEVDASDVRTDRSPRRRRIWSVAGVAVAVLALLAVVLLFRDTPADVADAEPESAAEEMVDVPLPSTGDGTFHEEQAGSLGANTYADPRTLAGGGPHIDPNTTITVRCRYYAPSVPSVVPDGFWYLIETDEWNGLWTPANSYMNGDVPGGPYIHNTDFAVPICR